MKIFGIEIKKQYILLHLYQDTWFYGEPLDNKKDIKPQIEYLKKNKASKFKVKTRIIIEF